jgi:glycosyltransferase involved in cell wall biosynthesis
MENRKIKILFVNHCMRLGGVETQLLYLLNGLNRNNFEIYLSLSEYFGPNIEFIPKDIDVFPIKNFREIKGLNYLVFWGIVEHIRRIRPDIVISFHSNNNIETVLAAKLCGIKCKVIACYPGVIMRGRLDWIRKPLLRWFDKIILVSDSVKLTFIDVYEPAENLITINNCINLDDIALKSDEICDHPWIINKEIPVIITIGRLVPGKNIDFAIKVVEEINKFQQLRFIIIGDGPEKQRLQKMIDCSPSKAYIDLVGPKVNPFPYLIRSDYFIFTSNSEGLPTVILEAMACKIPIFSTKYNDGRSEIVVHNRNGFIFEAWKPEEAASTFLSITAKSDQVKAVVEIGYSDVKNLYSINKYVNAYENLFFSLMSQNQN